MKNPVIGKCALCLAQAELRESHFVPKALYRLVRAGTRGEHPLQITAEGECQLQGKPSSDSSVLSVKRGLIKMERIGC